MPLLLSDPTWEAEILAERHARGIDAFDEVWDGIYVITPPKDNEHQSLAGEICTILYLTFKANRLGVVYAGINISDRRDDWERNYRCPDIAAFLRSTRAVNCHSHYFGGPDFAIEIVSPHDRAWEKVPFYEKVGTQELMFVDRNPWKLTLFRLIDGRLGKVGESSVEDGRALRSDVIPFTWRLIERQRQPAIEVAHDDGVQRWVVSGDEI